jgi:aryl-alcohol dehydrogenase-like predicted oxidoreductase
MAWRPVELWQMPNRKLGSSDLMVSDLCLGTMQFGWTADTGQSEQVLDAAQAAGINFIDTADIYSRWVPGHSGGEAESIIGAWLRRRRGLRTSLVIASKVRGPMGPGPDDQGLSRRHITQAAEASLRRLGIETMDLYQLHWPDEATPMAETLKALDDLVRQGKVRYLGLSNFPAWLVIDSLWQAERGGFASFVSCQPHFNLLHRREYEAELQAACQRHGLGVIPYSPLAGGILTGKYSAGKPPAKGSRAAGSDRMQRYLKSQRTSQLLAELRRIAQHHSVAPAAVALAWLRAQPGVTSPIIGPRTVDQLQSNLDSMQLELSSAEVAELDRITAWQKGALD